MKNLVFIILCIMIINGCSNASNVTDDMDTEKELTRLKELNRLIEEELTEIKHNYEIAQDRIPLLESENSGLKQTNESLPISVSAAKPGSVLDEEELFVWTHRESWDSIRITEYYPDYDVENPEITTVELNDPLMRTTRPDKFFYGIVNYGEPNDPGSGGRYRYEFISDEEIFKVEVYDSHCFRYNGVFYHCIGNIGVLSDAFIPEKKEYTNNAYTDFLYDSSMFIGEKMHRSPLFDKPKIQLITKIISEFRDMAIKDETTAGEAVEILSFYKNGNMVKAIIYEDFICIIQDGKKIWLESEDRSPQTILNVLGAG